MKRTVISSCILTLGHNHQLISRGILRVITTGFFNKNIMHQYSLIVSRVRVICRISIISITIKNTSEMDVSITFHITPDQNPIGSKRKPRLRSATASSNWSLKIVIQYRNENRLSAIKNNGAHLYWGIKKKKWLWWENLLLGSLRI